MPPGDDHAYLVETVGDALAKGVAATVAAAPADAVEYLARWLQRCGPARLHERARERACSCRMRGRVASRADARRQAVPYLAGPPEPCRRPAIATLPASHAPRRFQSPPCASPCPVAHCRHVKGMQLQASHEHEALLVQQHHAQHEVRAHVQLGCQCCP